VNKSIHIIFDLPRNAPVLSMPSENAACVLCLLLPLKVRRITGIHIHLGSQPS